MKIYLFNSIGWVDSEYRKRDGNLPENAHALPAGIPVNLAFWDGSEVTGKTQVERDAYDTEQVNATKLAKTTFTKLEIREAFKALGQESDLDTLLEGNSEFMTYWQEAQEINLNHPVTVQALSNFTSADLAAVKMEVE